MTISGCIAQWMDVGMNMAKRSYAERFGLKMRHTDEIQGL